MDDVLLGLVVLKGLKDPGVSDPSGILHRGGGEERGRSTPAPLPQWEEENQGDYKALSCSLMPGKASGVCGGVKPT